MLKRKIDEKLIFWKENRKQALLVKGGKTGWQDLFD